MIRRDVAARNGAPAFWVLISQIDHAHLAGQLAEHWGAGPFAALRPRDALLWAIYHHDDGWHAWDPLPETDSQTGIPRQFTEMEPAETIQIWTRSIESAAARGPLEAYLVAEHFCRLGRRATAGKQDQERFAPFLAFLDHYEAQARDWVSRWQTENPTHNTSAIAQSCLEQLQFFDTFSLWFCCGESYDRESVETPSGTDLTITPQTPYKLQLSPWPLTVKSLELTNPGRVVPVGHYATQDDLAAAPAESITLRWQLTPEA